MNIYARVTSDAPPMTEQENDQWEYDRITAETSPLPLAGSVDNVFEGFARGPAPSIRAIFASLVKIPPGVPPDVLFYPNMNIYFRLKDSRLRKGSRQFLQAGRRFSALLCVPTLRR